MAIPAESLILENGDLRWIGFFTVYASRRFGLGNEMKLKTELDIHERTCVGVEFNSVAREIGKKPDPFTLGSTVLLAILKWKLSNLLPKIRSPVPACNNGFVTFNRRIIIVNIAEDLIVNK